MPAVSAAPISCWWVSLPEDPAQRDGRTVELAVLRVGKPQPTQPPVVWLHGGPGAGVLDQAQQWLAARGHGPPFAERELILFDQRGVGRSRPALCPSLAEALADAVLTQGSAAGKAVRAHFARCLAELAVAGIDPARYRAQASALDLRGLRIALRIEHWAVAGSSYGTTLALRYADLDAPAITALLLDSVYPPGVQHYHQLDAQLHAALAGLAAQCRQNPRCAARFDPLRDYAAIRARLDQAEGWLLRERLHRHLYDAARYPMLPLWLNRIAAGELGLLEVGRQAWREDMARVQWAAFAAVECYDRVPFEPTPIPLATPLLMSLVAREACPQWPARAEQAPAELAPKPMPSLLLAGGLDPITPPSYTLIAAAALRAPALVLPGAGHGVLFGDPCTRALAGDFLNAPTRARSRDCTAARPELRVIEHALIAPGWPWLLEPGSGPRPWIVRIGVLGLVLLWLSSIAEWMRTGARSWVAPALSSALLLGWAVGCWIALAQAARTEPALLYLGLPSTAALGWPALLLSLAAALAGVYQARHESFSPHQLAVLGALLIGHAGIYFGELWPLPWHAW